VVPGYNPLFDYENDHIGRKLDPVFILLSIILIDVPSDIVADLPNEAYTTLWCNPLKIKGVFVDRPVFSRGYADTCSSGVGPSYSIDI